MDRSIYLGRIMGIYLIVISAGMLLHMERFIQQIDSLLQNDSLIFLTGFFTLIVGTIAIVSHNVWCWNWRVIITIICWIIFIKGASIILWPTYLILFSMDMMSSVTTLYVTAAIDLLFGFVLCYYGFFKK